MKTINQLHKHDKPREKLVAKGVQALKNEELMALLLGRGVVVIERFKIVVVPFMGTLKHE